MEKIAKIICAVIVGGAFVMSPLYCCSDESASDAAELVKEAKEYIQQGEKEKAVATLDAAFEAADSSGDYGSLMEIGDLYVAIDTSLDEKAMKAWTAAGRWKCQ